MKTKGFDVEASLQDEDGLLENLATAILIAAVKMMQLVAERDAKAKRPLTDLLDPADQPALALVCQSLKGKTRQSETPMPKPRSPRPPGSS
jgi:hypothetical protein